MFFYGVMGGVVLVLAYPALDARPKNAMNHPATVEDVSP